MCLYTLANAFSKFIYGLNFLFCDHVILKKIIFAMHIFKRNFQLFKIYVIVPDKEKYRLQNVVEHFKRVV